MGEAVIKDAVISPCGAYRYSLLRRWVNGPALEVVMLNPSTADAEIDDPTIRRLISFGQRNYYSAIHVSNLFAFRATSPKDMLAAIDPVGPEGATHLERALIRSWLSNAPVLAAWGARGAYRNADQRFITLAKKWNVSLVCLGQTADGLPRHPLYIRGDQPFKPFA